MSSPPSIFILGATGFIGGSILSALLRDYPNSTITVQYRQDAHKDVLEKFNKNILAVKVLLSDTALLSSLASNADVVINCADCDDLASTSALIEGLEKGAQARTAGGKPKAVYLHTSGTGELADPDFPLGTLDTTVYDDADLDQIMAMPESRPHRKVTNQVVKAFERGHFLGFVILPSTIYGEGTGPINRLSLQIPNVVEYALSEKRATYVAPGENVWCHVHINSLARLYTSLLALSLSPSAPSPPQNGFEHYIFATSVHGPFSWRSVAETVGDILKELGELAEGGAVGKVGAQVTGSTSVGISNRAKELVGWEDVEVLGAWLRSDVEATVKKFREGNGKLKTWWGN